jgi:hypothetical protein
MTRLRDFLVKESEVRVSAPSRALVGHQRMCVRSPHVYGLAKRSGLLFLRHLVGALTSLRADVKVSLPIAFLISMQAANGQSLRQALEPRLVRLSAKSHSAVLLWHLPRSETLAAVRAEVFAEPRCLGSLAKPFLLLAYLSERCNNLTSRPEVPPCPRGDDLADPQALPGGGVSLELRPCVGRATTECPVECWYKPGHGKLDMSRALAVSCNQYFYQLAKQTSPRAFLTILTAQGVSPQRSIGCGVGSLRP